jgi:uncharacterized membrane protein
VGQPLLMSEPLLYRVATWVIVLGLFVAMNLAWLGFFRVGQRVRRRKMDADLGPLEASMGGLVALILAFSFSLAADRHDEREHVIVDEANAIGTAFLRCDLLEPADRSFCRQRLREYTRLRVEFFEIGHDPARLDSVVQRSSRIASELWNRIVPAVRAGDTPSRAQLVVALNETFDLGQERLAATRHVVAGVITAATLAMCIAWAAFAGYGYGLKGNARSAAWIGFSALICVVVHITLDLDRPGRGVIRPVRGHSIMLDLMRELEAAEKG